MALNQINGRYARNHLYRVSKASVKRVSTRSYKKTVLSGKTGVGSSHHGIFTLDIPVVNRVLLNPV